MLTAGCSMGGGIKGLKSSLINPSGSKVALSLSSSSLTLSEGATALIGFALAKPLPSSTTINVSLNKIGGSSQPRFAPFAQTIFIPAGQQVGSVTLVTINDAIYEGTETFELSFSSDQLDTTSASLRLTLTDDEVIPSISFASDTQILNKTAAGTLPLTATLSGPSALPVNVPLVISGTAVLGTHANISATSLTIAPLSLSAAVNVTAINDGIIEADRTVVVDLTSTAANSLGATPRATVTIVNDLINSFTISGVTSSAVPTASTVLVGTDAPGLSWAAAANATSYDLTIFNSDGTTIACATQSTTSLNLSPTSCHLTVGASYKAVVAARAGTGSRAATNSPFLFTVNTDPTPAVHGPFFVMKGSSLTVTTASLLTTDADADVGETSTLTIDSVTASLNSAVNLTSGVITYTPNASFTGTDTFTYRLKDVNGGGLRMVRLRSQWSRRRPGLEEPGLRIFQPPPIGADQLIQLIRRV